MRLRLKCLVENEGDMALIANLSDVYYGTLQQGLYWMA